MKNVTIPSQFLQELLALCGPEDHELRERVLLAAAPVHPAEGVPAQPLQMFESPRAKILMQAWQEGFAACRDAEYVGEEAENDAFNQSMTLNHCIAEDELHATHPTQQGLEPVKLLAKDHANMRVDYSGLLGKVQREMKRSAPGYAEMIRQLQGHLQELGQRWYAGQTEVVDELLQLYCIESEARKAIAAQAKQGEQANG